MRDAGVLQLVEPERQALEHLEIQHGHDGGAQHRAGDRAHAAEDHHGQHADRLQERERLGIDEDLLGREHHAHHAGERGAAREGQELHAHERHAHRLGGHLVLADRLPGAADVRVLQAPVTEDHDDDDEEHQEVDRPSA